MLRKALSKFSPISPFFLFHWLKIPWLLCAILCFCVAHVNIRLEADNLDTPFPLSGMEGSPRSSRYYFFNRGDLECSGECCHTCVADAAILSCPCFGRVPCLVSVPMSLWLMVYLVIPSMPLSLVSGAAPDTLLRRFLPWGGHIVMGTRESSQCCSSCCPCLGVVGRCRRACWSPHPSSPWPEAEACASPASRRWTTVWSRPPWHCTKTSGQKGRVRGGEREEEGEGAGGKCLSFELAWQQRVSTILSMKGFRIFVSRVCSWLSAMSNHTTITCSSHLVLQLLIMD